MTPLLECIARAGRSCWSSKMYAGAWVSQHVELSWRADRCAWKEHTTKFWTIHRSVTSILGERCPVLRHGSNERDSSSPPARSSSNDCCQPNRAMSGNVCLRPVGTRGGRGDGWGPCACPDSYPQRSSEEVVESRKENEAKQERGERNAELGSSDVAGAVGTGDLWRGETAG